MSRAVQWPLLGSIVVAALIALAGCGHYFNMGEREAWRHDAEVACLNSGAVKDGPERVRISTIGGPGICGMDFPIRVSQIGDSSPLGYDDEALRPPGAVPDGALPQHWPIQSNALPPPSYPAQSYPPVLSATGLSIRRPTRRRRCRATNARGVRANVALCSRRAGARRGRCGVPAGAAAALWQRTRRPQQRAAAAEISAAG